jgi:hypothetical protein
MHVAILSLPDEPVALKGLARTLLEQAPDEGLPLILAGEWIADLLWQRWSETLRPRGMEREHLRQIIAAYGNELRLWVVGERPWEQAVAGLAGRVSRRLTPPTLAGGDDAWQVALRRVDVAPESDLATIVARLGELQLLFDLDDAGAAGRTASASVRPAAIVWAGGRPRDPEVPFGESRSGAFGAVALAEALGRFLLKDPAYPPQRLHGPRPRLALVAG